MAGRCCIERLVSDELWELVEPLIPKPQQAERGRTGREDFIRPAPRAACISSEWGTASPDGVLT